jgi:hydroxymethylglutaryl-CoA reductase (NADPH)
MAFVPKAVLKKLYTHSSLRNEKGGVRFAVKNRLAPATLKGIRHVQINGQPVPADKIDVGCDNSPAVGLEQITPDQPIDFPLGTRLTFHLQMVQLDEGRHDIDVAFDTEPFGRLSISVSDELRSKKRDPAAIPRDGVDDYCDTIIRARQDFIAERTGTRLDHTTRYSFSAELTRGNIEHFTGAVQVPMGIAGPLLVKGEHAKGEFYVPLATSEGTLVASYNRGMRVLHESGGVTCAVVGDNMQRAPVFIFKTAAEARRFADWVVERTEDIRAASEATDPYIHLKYIDYYLANKFAYLRFNFTTGDAAGMNMVGKATFAACNWILQNCDVVETQRFYLESNFATDKKASMINIMRTRGKRVTAEAVIKRDVLLNVMDADTESLYYHSKVANVGAMLSGANNNGCHSANAITAMFIATGQDVANVSESSTALAYLELTREKDLYMSITLPSLIVATCGGGTALPTQRESLEMMDCYGVGKVGKFAEIVAGTVLAGEISLAAAISSLDWVSSHDQFGRNDPGKVG